MTDEESKETKDAKGTLYSLYSLVSLASSDSVRRRYFAVSTPITVTIAVPDPVEWNS